jgi:hypothetical protein
MVDLRNLPTADVETREQPQVIREKVRVAEREELQPIIHREREVTEVHQVTQPIYETQTLPTIVEERCLPTETRADIIHAPLPEQQAQYRGAFIEPVREVLPVEREAITKPAIVEETIRKHVIEEIQPVIYREVFEPHVIRQTKPIYERIVEAPIIIQETRQPRYASCTTVCPPGTVPVSTGFGSGFGMGTGMRTGTTQWGSGGWQSGYGQTAGGEWVKSPTGGWVQQSNLGYPQTGFGGQQFAQQPYGAQQFAQQGLGAQQFGQPSNLYGGQQFAQQPLGAQQFAQQPLSGQQFGQTGLTGQQFAQPSSLGTTGQQFGQTGLGTTGQQFGQSGLGTTGQQTGYQQGLGMAKQALDSFGSSGQSLNVPTTGPAPGTTTAL